MSRTDVPKILIVDDLARNLDVLEVMLAPIDCAIVRAQSADEALLCLLHDDFAAVILDIQMPDMSGIDLAKLIKQRKRSEHVPILFLTAHMLDETDALLGYGVGAVDYLSKPVNPEILRSKVGVFIDLFTKTRALAELNDALQQEVGEREKAQEALRLANEELEHRVRERTAALNRALQEARKAGDEAQRQSRLKDDFLATLSHELRTPMNIILGWLTILDAGKPVPDPASAIAVIRRNAEHQAKLIEDLLDMTRLMAGNLQLDITGVDAGGLLHRTIQGLQPEADGKGVCLSASVEPGLGEVLADAKRLQQVLWNLVHNAVKFTPSGGHVDIRATRVDGHLRMTVQDTGQGIAPEFLPHVFERFRQQDASATKEAYGLGLGLSIAKLLVELHGGSIQASSAGVGQGATFTVEIPAATSATIGHGDHRAAPGE